MSHTVRITPAGRLVVELSPDEQPVLEEPVASKLERAFANSSADGLLALVTTGGGVALPPALVFWREIGQRYFHAVCQLGEELPRKWKGVEPLDDEQFEELIAMAPPMRGLEHLSAMRLRTVWRELHALVIEQAEQDTNGPEAYLRGMHLSRHLVGRVTFHLAENKRDESRPFAFLATYAHRISAGETLKHLPLGQALKEYAGANNQTQLSALLEPVRRAAITSALVREMLDSRSLFHAQAWDIRQAYRLLKEIPRLEEAGLVVRVPDWWSVRRPPRPHVQIRLGERPVSQIGADAMLDFSVTLAIDGEPLTEEEREQLLANSQGLALLRGRWVEVDRKKVDEALAHWRRLEAEHVNGISFIQGMRLLAGTDLKAGRDDEPADEWSRVVSGDWLRETLQRIRDPSGITAIQPGTHLRATLRPYQADGIRWLWFMTQLGLGACLADDMGLGKTIQLIDLLLQWHASRTSIEDSIEQHDLKARRPSRKANGDGAARPSSGSNAPSLLIVPASLVGNWKREIERFAPDLRVLYAHRSECDAETLSRVADQPSSFLRTFDLVITTYGAARRSSWLADVTWRLIAVDEAQAIKNASSAQTRAIKRLRGLGRIALTGTPVENQLGDLWSIFDFCCPGLLGSATQFQQFVKQLNKRQDAEAFGRLRRLVRPYILRRMKTDPTVVADLPDKIEMRVECGLSATQAVLYAEVVKDFAKRLEEVDGMARRGLVLSVLMQLKQICNHPAQYLKSSTFAPEDSGKFSRLAAVCEPILERQEKVLVFTQFQSICQPLADFLAGVFHRRGLILSGATAVRKRTSLVQEFQDDAGPPFLVVSVKAGGSGLNLTAASHVIHFDRWWNPAVENQATDRAYRIGQKKNVLVHKFVCRGTVEERIDQMIQSKQQLADTILDQGSEAVLTELTDDELLKFVAIDLNRSIEEE